LPRVALIETRNQRLHHGLTQAALDALANNLRKTGQISMVFVNKRGYAPVLACQQCGWLSNCPNCSAKQVLHLKDRLLRCHHCGSHAPIPHACPSCGNQDIQPLGEGTQRIESALAEYFPQARILRIDRDNTQGKENWDIIYQKIKQGEVDLIIGTQMLAKGHDFGCLSLVLIIGADGGLYASDYRASERLFGLLTQVVGRAGRAELTGQVLIQTQLSEHPLYQALIRHDFNGFAANLLAERKTNHFPPFMSHAILRANAPTLTQAESWLSACMVALEPVCQSLANQPATQAISLYGPAPAPMLKVANRERAQIVIECPSRVALQKFLQQARPFIDALSTSAVRWHIDVDPIDL
jgi:primosomal protein N' (replication factor Y)